MNLFFHQFKTDVRHFRWRLLVLWLSFAAELVLAGNHSLSGSGQGITRFLIEVWQIIFAFALVVSLVQADPLVGTSAVWLTRPVRRGHVFWAKTAFIVLCLFVPRLVVQMFGWAMAGYSLHLELAAVEETLLFSVSCVLTVAVLAALTRDLSRFFLAVGIVVGCIFAWTLIVEMLVRAHFLHQAAIMWPNDFQRVNSAETVAFLILLAGALLAWVFQALADRWRAAVVCFATGLLAFPVVTTVWSVNFLAPEPLPSPAPLTLLLVETNRPVRAPGQLLSTELALAGVPPRHFAVLEDFSGSIYFNGDPHATQLWHPRFTDSDRIRSEYFPQPNRYFHVIQDFFPAETLWFNQDIGYDMVQSFFMYDQNSLKHFDHHLPPGKLDGHATVDLFGIKKVAEEPLRFAMFQVLPGLRVTIQKVRLADGVISISLDECATQLMFDRDVNTADTGNNSRGQSHCTYVLYHPGSGEAFMLAQDSARTSFPALMSGEAHWSLQLNFPYPALRERLVGVSAADWLREARLCVFVPVYTGTSQLAFHEDDYHWPGFRNSDVRRQKEILDDVQAIQQATLPASPTAGETEAYLDEILLNLPDNWDDTLRKTVEMKLEALGPNGLPALLHRLPLAQKMEDSLVLPAITKVVTREQLPDLRAALLRDNNLVRVFLEKNWQADARGVLISKLSDHRQPLPPDALNVVAGAKETATYGDLRWHFVHLDSGHDQVIHALEQCPGFDIAAAVREAWQSARLGVINPAGLAAVAAKQGLPDALNQAVIQADKSPDTSGQQRELAQLALLTGYNGPTNNTLSWLTSNLARFRYDPAQQRYLLEPNQP